MTRTTSSDINYLGINENFPVAGQDNDTQTFRDNFDTIKIGLRSAQTDITDIKSNAAFTDVDNDFNQKELSGAVFRSTTVRRFDGGIVGAGTSQLDIDFQNGGYQVWRFSSNMSISFQNFPTASIVQGNGGIGQLGKVTLELYGDGTARTLTFLTPGNNAVYRRNSGFPTILTVSSTTAPVIIDVWRHSSNYIFMHFYGQYT
jgi:hypothetical protein